MKKLLLALCVPALLCAQTASYPTSVVADSQLKVAVNNMETRLRGSISATQTSIEVTDASRITANMLLTIEREVINVTAVSGNTLTCTRGYDGTTAAAHTSNRAVQSLVTAWHHNALAAEVKAIQTALGAGLANLEDPITSDTYNFSAQTPGVSLTEDITNSVTLAPCPAGVAGTNVGHRLYISGGTGAAEAVLITGGTCTSGAGSGTILFTPANNHTGAWTIQSATAGIREMAAVSSAVRLPAGTRTIYGKITLPGYGAVLTGYGKGVTTLAASGFSTADVVEFYSAEGLPVKTHNAIRDLTIQCEAGQTSGSGLSVLYQQYFAAERLGIDNCPHGVNIDYVTEGDFNDLTIRELEDTSGIGINVIGPGNSNYALKFDRVVVVSTAPVRHFAGLRVRQAGDVQVSNSHFMRSNFGALIDPPSGNAVASYDSSKNYYDGNNSGGLSVAPYTGGSVARGRSVGDWFASAAGGPGISISSEGNGGLVDGFEFIGAQVYLNAQYGLIAAGASGEGVQNIRVTNSVFSNNSYGNSGTYPGAFFNISKFIFENNRSGPVDGLANTQSYGVAVYPAATDNYTIRGNDLTGNVTGGMSDQGTGTHKVIASNLGVDTTYVTLASASTITLPATGENSVYITGNTPITTIAGAYEGREITLVFLHASPGALGNSADIPSSLTPALNIPVRCKRVNAQWYCR